MLWSLLLNLLRTLQQWLKCLDVELMRLLHIYNHSSQTYIFAPCPKHMFFDQNFEMVKICCIEWYNYWFTVRNYNYNEVILLGGFCFCHFSKENFIWLYLPVILAGFKNLYVIRLHDVSISAVME